jgi:hypothetical protein
VQQNLIQEQTASLTASSTPLISILPGGPAATRCNWRSKIQKCHDGTHGPDIWKPDPLDEKLWGFH